MLDRLEGEGGGFVGEAVQQGLLQGQVGRVQGLEDVRLQTVAEEAWWQNMAVLCWTGLWFWECVPSFWSGAWPPGWINDVNHEEEEDAEKQKKQKVNKKQK